MAILAILGAIGTAIAATATTVGSAAVAGAGAVGGAALTAGQAVLPAASAVSKGAISAGQGLWQGAGQGAQMASQGLWQGTQAMGRGAESAGSSLWNSTAGRVGNAYNPTSSYSGDPAVRQVATNQMRSSAHEGIWDRAQDFGKRALRSGLEGYSDSQGVPPAPSAVGVGGQETPAEPFQAAEYPPISTAYAGGEVPNFSPRDAIKRYTGGLL